MEPRFFDRRASLRAVAVCAFCYLYVFPYQETLNNPNENVRFYMTAALAEEGRYEIDSMRERWGWVNDAGTRGGHFYSVKAPATSLLAVPGYALYRSLCALTGRVFDRTEALWACRLCASILPALAFLWFLHRYLAQRAFDPVLRDAVFYSVALGSLLYGYGMLLVSHTLSAVVSFSAFMLLAQAREQGRCSPLRAAGAGLLAAATTLCEYPGLPCSIALTGYALYVLAPRKDTARAERVRAIGAYVAGGLVPALALMHFQWRAFGNPLTPGHLFMENQSFKEIHERGLYGAVGPSAEAVYGLLVDLGAGLFPLTPVLVLAPLGLWWLAREGRSRAEAVCVVAVFALTLLVIASMANWRGGWTIGPRYLALTVPFLGWAALFGLQRVHERSPLHARVLALGAAASAIVASGLPSAYYPHLPPEFTRPLPQLFAVLIAHDYAPTNAGNWLSWYGTRSMLPLALAVLFGLWASTQPAGTLRARLSLVGGGLLVALALCLPLWQRPDREPGVSGAVAFVTRRFHPAGHDRAARLVARLRAADVMRQRDLDELAALYEREGRSQEAARARRGKIR